MSYSVLHVVHLLAAIFFIGTLFFEVMILGRIRQQIGEQTMPLVERAVGARSRVVLHWVVLFVYGAGIGLAWYHRQALANPFASSFATQLTLKIVLADRHRAAGQGHVLPALVVDAAFIRPAP